MALQFATTCRLRGVLIGSGRRRLTFSPLPAPDGPGIPGIGNVTVVTGKDGDLEVLLLPGVWRVIGLDTEAQVAIPDAPRARWADCLRVKE